MGKENRIYDCGRKLPVVEEFYSLQGEGYHMGRAAYFLRIGGCDIGCSWCDTKISWNPSLHPLTEIDHIVERVVLSGADSVVITGGEPLMYDLDRLCCLFKSKSIKTFLETSGAYELSGQWDWICLSPKKQQPPIAAIHARADELKVIISRKEDLEWAESNAELVSTHCKLYLQPEWGAYKIILPEIVEFVKSNTKWTVSLQSHKFMHIP